jgi:hypothetical protein
MPVSPEAVVRDGVEEIDGEVQRGELNRKVRRRRDAAAAPERICG